MNASILLDNHNEYIEKENYLLLIINSLKYGIVNIKIDKDDYEFIRQYNWSLHVWKYKNKISKIYARCKNGMLHRLLTNCPKGMVVDHINHDSLDNRRTNLRVCTNMENMQNRKIHTNNSLNIFNVYYAKEKNKYRVQIRKNKIKYTKYFKDIKEAEDYAIKKRAELYPELIIRKVANHC